MKVRTNIKSRGFVDNQNEKVIKIKSGVNAAGIKHNHNEKINGDATSLTESKKTFAKKLRLNKETIRELKDSDLKQIAGGRPVVATEQTSCKC